MAKTYFPFDAGAGKDVMENQWGQMARFWRTTGVIKQAAGASLNEMAVFADSSGMQVKVPSGEAWVEGFYFKSTAQETLSISTAHATLTRWDTVIIRLDWTANTIDLAVLTGTASASPSDPALTQNTTTWEIALARVVVGAAVSTIASDKIVDQRTLSRYGVWPELYNRAAATISAGGVAIIDSANSQAAKTTTVSADPASVVVFTEDVAVGSKGLVARVGEVTTVLVQGNVSIGDWLVTSSTAGRGAASSVWKPGAFAQAVSAYAGGGAGSVTALIGSDPRGQVQGGGWSAMAKPLSPNTNDDEFDDASVGAGWTEWDHGTTMTPSEAEQGLILTHTTNAGHKWAGMYKSLPAGDFTIQVRFNLTADALGASKYIYGGIGLFEDASNSTKKFCSVSAYINAALNAFTVVVYDWTNYTTLSTTPVAGTAVSEYWRGVYVRLRRNGTTFYPEWSIDPFGKIFYPFQYASLSFTLGYTPLHMGVLSNNYNTTATQKVVYDHFRYTASDVGATGLGLGRRT
jgi:hypothetical protein